MNKMVNNFTLQLAELFPFVRKFCNNLSDKFRTFNKSKTVDALIDKLEKIKASIQAKVDHPFRVIKCKFGYRKTRHWGLRIESVKWVSQKNIISSGEFLSINSRFCGGYSELP